MRRRIIQHGQSTLTISLPASWVKKYNIKKGDELDIQEQQRNLIIQINPEEKPRQKKITLDLKDTGKQLSKEMIGIAYKCGHSNIEVYNIDKSIYEYVQGLTPLLLEGCEVMEQVPGSCIISHIHQDVPEELNKMVRRIFIIVQELGKGVMAMYQEQKVNESLLDYEHAVNRISNYCQRIILNKKEGEGKNAYLYVILWSLEKISDEYAKMVQYVLDKKKIKANKEIITLFKEINTIYNEYYLLFFKYDTEKMKILKKKITAIKEQKQTINIDKRDDIWINTHNIITKLSDSVNSIIGYHMYDQKGAK